MAPRHPSAACRVACWLALASALASLAACKAKPSAADAFCENWVAAYCEGNQSCCTSTDDTYADADSCKTAQRARCALGTGSAFSGATPLASFDAAEGARALEDLRTAGTAGACVEPPSLDTYALVVGTLAIGDDCSPLGGDLSPVAACEPGARCLLAASRAGTLTGQCVTESELGQACVAETCIPSAYCAGLSDPSAGGAGSCTARKLDGETCGSARECLTGACASSICGTLGGPTLSAWCVPGAGLGAVVPPTDLGTDLGGDVDAGL
jgi:hypothetical protein